ncbi:SusC/RagA family TonB-linked outer membrane protein [Segatella salivae]|uniref:SusC/RagA family TonB-linked outer membrane protein n=1 Tax=Segatella salivae TaxID=228604 RepID=UPI00241F3FD4|nr:SusC/RagA family TonB-linked outer membrane protein [Segatella salivae]
MTTIGMKGQHQVVKLDKTTTTIQQLISTIEKQTNLSIDYGQNALDLTKQVKVNSKTEKLSALLDAMIKETDLEYTISGRHVIITKNTPQKPKQTGRKQTIKGQVQDVNGNPLIGVTVKVRGTNNAVVTDLDGNYTISANRGDILECSYVGFTTKDARVNGNQLNLTLHENSKELNEVVVTALGIKREQKALSYNVQQVAGDAVSVNKDANFINSLNGKVAGVNINASSSGAGGASKVVMRGARSIMQSSNVLYVIDGIPMLNTGKEGSTEFASSGTSEGIADLNSEDIESMSILTGAAAAALYGEKASNGAIVITTKKGSVGHTLFTITQNTELSTAFHTPKFQNKYGTGSSIRESGSESYSWGRLLNESNFMGYNPIEDYFKTGVMTTEAFTMSTGTEKNQTFLSASALRSAGIVPNNKYNRYNFTVRNTTSLLKDRMILDVGASYIIQNDRNMINQGVYNNPLVTAYLFPRGNDYQDMAMYEHYDTTRKIYVQNWDGLISELVGQNPYWINYRTPRTNKKYRYMMNAGLTYKFTDWLSLVARIRIDNSINTYEEKFYASTNMTLTGSSNGMYNIQKSDGKQTYGDVIANINKRFFEDKLSLVANVGTSLSDIKWNQLGNRGPIDENLIPNVFTVTQINRARLIPEQSGYHDQTKSLFASVELGWRSQLYLTMTERNDWPSMLAGPHSNKSSFFYPSIGSSWIISESFNLPQQIDYLKVRASFASVGLSFPRWYANPKYTWDENKKQWSSQTTYPMYNLKPERTDSWEFGLQTRLFKHFNIDLTYYLTKTYNQTFDPKISASSGYSKMYIQTGNVRNQGLELALGYNNTWGEFSWRSNYTFSMNRNKIKELVTAYVHPQTKALITVDKLDEGGLGAAHFILKKGGTLGDLYSLSDIQRDSNGKVYVDESGKVYKNTNVEDIKLGSIFPKSNMAWRNEFSWKGLNLGVMVAARFGGIVYSATQANLDYYGVSKTTANIRDKGGVSINDGENIINPETWFTTIGASDGIPIFYTYSATNVRLQEASIGYTFKKNVLFGFGELTFSLVGRNLLMLYCKAPFDPETTATTGNYYQGIDKFMTPSSRNLGFNIKLKF